MGCPRSKHFSKASWVFVTVKPKWRTLDYGSNENSKMKWGGAMWLWEGGFAMLTARLQVALEIKYWPLGEPWRKHESGEFKTMGFWQEQWI